MSARKSLCSLANSHTGTRGNDVRRTFNPKVEGSIPSEDKTRSARGHPFVTESRSSRALPGRAFLPLGHGSGKYLMMLPSQWDATVTALAFVDETKPLRLRHPIDRSRLRSCWG